MNTVIRDISKQLIILRQNVTTSFWRNDNVIMVEPSKWVSVLSFFADRKKTTFILLKIQYWELNDGLQLWCGAVM